MKQKRNTIMPVVGALLVARAHKNYSKHVAAFYDECEERVAAKYGDITAKEGEWRLMQEREYQLAILPAKLHLLENIVYSYGVGLVILALGLELMLNE
jgi:hypothetical protein